MTTREISEILLTKCAPFVKNFAALIHPLSEACKFLFNELLLLEFSTCWKFSVKGKSLGNGGVNSEGKFHSTPLTPKPKDINGNRNVLGYTNTPNKRYPKQIASQLP